MSSTTPTNENEKLKEVLQLLILPDYAIASTTYFDILLSHIAKNITTGCTANSETIDKSSLQKWVLHALQTWTAGWKPCQAVVTFTIKLVGLLGSNESDFLYLYREDVFAKLKAVFGLGESGLQPSVKMAYASMLLEFLNHNSGRRWIVESGSWRDVIRFCHTNHTLYVTRESQKFVWKLLLLEAGNVKFCEEVISFAAEPLIKNTFSPQPCQTLEDNYFDRNELLITVIDLLTAVLENTLFVSMDNTIPRLLESVTNLECRIKGLFETCISTKFLGHIMNLMYLLLLMRLKDGIDQSSGKVDPEVLNTFHMNLRYIDSMLLAKKCILQLVKGGKQIIIYWKKLTTLCKITLPDGERLDIQSLMIMLMPLGSCMPLQERSGEEMLRMFGQKIYDILSPYSQRLYYLLRDTLLKEDMPIEHICKVTVQTTMDIVDILDRDGTVILFQLMYYILEAYVRSPVGNTSSHESRPLPMKENPRIPKLKRILDGDPIVQCPNLLSVLLDSLSTIIQKFKLKWPECLETTTILYLPLHILSHPNVIPKVCVQALSLCKLAIQNFMAPNMALLMQPDSRENEMGPVLYKRMHDPNWEVRDSVLEVINTIATISEDKYPAFQDLLLENGFPQVIVDVAASDGESYVRATALTCTATFVRINKIWDEKLCNLDLPKMGIDLMTNESEGIVRKEAVRLVKELYVHRKWPKSIIEEMAKAMAAAAVLDLHWEVKVYALEFWAQFIKSQLSDQGMLDGCFPTVTFSKEHKKIVSLNNEEIRKRILKVLDESAKQNCLGVLLATLEDDSDFQVCKASGEIIKKLQCVFTKYGVSETEAVPLLSNQINVSDKISSCSKDNANLLSNDTEKLESKVVPPSVPTDVIDSIADADDMNLLSSIYDQTMNMSPDSQSKDEEKLRCIPEVDKNQFLRSVLMCNIDAYIEEKNRWLKTYTNSFGSVVDDILSAHARKNVNDMDCY